MRPVDAAGASARTDTIAGMTDASTRSARRSGSAEQSGAGGTSDQSAEPVDPGLARVVRDTVAVVDVSGASAAGGAAAVAVWHVDVGPDIGLARLCGAWLLDAGTDGSQIRTLLRGRRVLATGSGAQALESKGVLRADGIEIGSGLEVEGGVTIEGWVAADATAATIRDEIGALQAAFEEEQRANSPNLVPPTWPRVPGAARPDDFSAADGTDDPAGTGAALTAARWLADLAEVWQKVEGQRLTRKFLRELGGPHHRSLPVALREGD